MAYKNHVEEQAEFNYDFFREKLEFLENRFKGDVLNRVRGKYIYVLLDGMYDCTYFVKTTVSDVRSVYGDIDFNFITELSGGIVTVYSLKEPNKKSFKGKLKYVPKGTLSLTETSILLKNNGEIKCISNTNMPILQDEKFIISACDNLFESDELGADYEYIEKHAFKFLINDKRISYGNQRRIDPECDLIDSQRIHYGICRYFDISASWGVAYRYAGNCFIFPLKREYIQRLFKNRDKENGRRRVIASLVNGYTRKDGTEVDGHLRSANTFSIDGRKFGIFIGGEDIEKIYPNTEKSKKRLNRDLRKSVRHGKITSIRG